MNSCISPENIFAPPAIRGFIREPMTIERVRELTLSFLPGLESGSLDFEVIEKGGSGRFFYRVRDRSGSRSWVAMAYSDDRSDNARFASITDFLIDHRIAVPAITGRNEAEGFLLVQDLGEIDLGWFAGKDWESEQKPAYLESLRLVFDLHEITEASQPDDLPELEFRFNAELYEWELDYFFNHFVTNFQSPEALSLRSDPSFLKLRNWLGELPRALVHRDFQSTNVMFHEGRYYLIDYQGMRFGLPEYDVASMVYDPYTDLSEEQRQELIDYYFQLKQQAGHGTTFAEYESLLDACAVQRLMQALGAYGFLGITKGKREFLQHIAPARERLHYVAERACPVLGKVLA